MGDGGAGKEARRARAEELARQSRIAQGTKDIRNRFANAFDEPYYAQLMADTHKAYDTDVQTQFENSRRALAAALRRSGLMQSSVKAVKEGELNEEKINADNQVTQRGVGFQNARRQEAAAAETSVLNQLNATADSQSAFANAAAQIEATGHTPAMPMLGQVFTDLTGGLATQADLERNNQARYNVFGYGNNSGKRFTRNVG